MLVLQFQHNAVPRFKIKIQHRVKCLQISKSGIKTLNPPVISDLLDRAGPAGQDRQPPRLSRGRPGSPSGQQVDHKPEACPL